jgi:asparagine synthase (glutamine-hydrolysing)
VCGIVGFQGSFEPEVVSRMSAQLAHRGPDGCGDLHFVGEERSGAVGMGHRRLAIIDLSPAGAQPMGVTCARCGAEDTAQLALVYNGELYNYRELREELVGRGHSFRGNSDSEVLLHLYAEMGPAMLDRLNGIFAFAIRDGRAADRPDGIAHGDLLIARDQLGVKPFYYAEVERGFTFASELKSLLATPGLSRELDAEAIHYLLAYLWIPAPYTPLAGVRKLPPGNAAVIRGGRIHRQWKYYELPYGQEPHSGGEEELAAELRERLETAVRRQMVSDVPVGAFLSGGLDSSAVVAMMRKIAPSARTQCYSIGFAGDVQIDGVPPDLPFARRVSEHLDVPLHTIEVGSDMVKELGRMLYHQDEPQADPAPINALLIAEQARRDGVPVLLSGAGGDDIFSGYRRHRALLAERMWGWIPRPGRSALASLAGALPVNGSALSRRVAKVFSHADLSPERRMIAYFWWSGEALRKGLYSREMASRLNGVDTAAPLLKSLEAIPNEHDPLNRMLFLEAKHFLADHNLNYTDKTGMAAGVEVRVPLLDLELVEFAARIPSALKQRGAEGKYIFKRAMEPYLPKDVIYRAKSGFGAPLRHWLRNELREQVEESLSESAVRRRGLFDPAAVRALIQRDRDGQVDGSYTIFALMCLEMWCQMFVDESTVMGGSS